MFERFGRELRTVVGRSERLATDEGADAVDAQHLLLALVSTPGSRAAGALAALGLDEPAVRAALDRELTSALVAVGVTPPPVTPVLPRVRTRPQFGRSAKLALERALEVAVERGDRTLDGRHLLVALARAEAGVMPRLLRELGTPAERIEAVLARTG